jgi:hypothetical protein
MSTQQATMALSTAAVLVGLWSVPVPPKVLRVFLNTDTGRALGMALLVIGLNQMNPNATAVAGAVGLAFFMYTQLIDSEPSTSHDLTYDEVARNAMRKGY